MPDGPVLDETVLDTESPVGRAPVGLHHLVLDRAEALDLDPHDVARL